MRCVCVCEWREKMVRDRLLACFMLSKYTWYGKFVFNDATCMWSVTKKLNLSQEKKTRRRPRFYEHTTVLKLWPNQSTHANIPLSALSRTHTHYIVYFLVTDDQTVVPFYSWFLYSLIKYFLTHVHRVHTRVYIVYVRVWVLFGLVNFASTLTSTYIMYSLLASRSIILLSWTASHLLHSYSYSLFVDYIYVSLITRASCLELLNAYHRLRGCWDGTYLFFGSNSIECVYEQKGLLETHSFT